MDFSNNTASDLQDEIIAPRINKEYREQVTKKMKDDKYMLILSMYFDSVFQDFESLLRTEIDLVEDDIRLVLGEYNSSFITYELEPGIYTSKDNSEAFFNILQPESRVYNNSVDVEKDDRTMKTKLVVRPGIIATRFNENSSFSLILGFTSGWDNKHYNKYTSQKVVSLTNTNKIHLKCDVIDGRVVKSLRQPIVYSFVLDKLPGCKVFCEPETIHYKNKTNLF